jgi:hypothetical protein
MNAQRCILAFLPYSVIYLFVTYLQKEFATQLCVYLIVIVFFFLYKCLDIIFCCFVSEIPSVSVNFCFVTRFAVFTHCFLKRCDKLFLISSLQMFCLFDLHFQVSFCIILLIIIKVNYLFFFFTKIMFSF